MVAVCTQTHGMQAFAWMSTQILRFQGIVTSDYIVKKGNVVWLTPVCCQNTKMTSINKIDLNAEQWVDRSPSRWRVGDSHWQWQCESHSGHRHSIPYHHMAYGTGFSLIKSKEVSASMFISQYSDWQPINAWPMRCIRILYHVWQYGPSWPWPGAGAGRVDWKGRINWYNRWSLINW